MTKGTESKASLSGEESRRALSQELAGVEGLIYRIATTLEPNSMHTASLAVVCEAIYLARQVMEKDQVGRHDVEDLLSAVEELEQKGDDWRIDVVYQQVWPALPERLVPEGPARAATEFALREWLARADTNGKSPQQLAEEFTAFCEAAEKPVRSSRKRKAAEA